MISYILKRPLFFASLFSVSMLLICSFLDFVGMITLCGVILFVFLLIIPFKTKLIFPAILSLIMSLTIIGVNIFLNTFHFQSAAKYVGEQAKVTGEVVSVADNKVQVKCDTVSVNGKKENVSFIAMLTLHDDVNLKPSSKISASVKFDDEAFSDIKSKYSICAYAFEIILDKSENKKSLNYIIYKSREFISDSIPFKSSETASFIQGIILGQKDNISGVFLNRFNTVGLSHYMALSGLHLIFAAAFAELFLMIFSVSYRVRSAVSLLVVFAFTFISGFSVSCVRAAIMMLIYYLGRMLGKIPDSLTSLSISCYIILLFAPYNLFSLSFLLSVFATFGIIVLFPFFRNLLDFNIKYKFIGYIIKSIRDVFLLSLCANIMCLPILAVYFKSICIISPIISVIVSFPMQILFYIGALGTIFFFVPVVSSVFSIVADWLYKIIEYLIEKFYFIESTTLTDGYRLFYFVIILFIVLIIGIYFLHRIDKTKRFISLYTIGFVGFCCILFVVNRFVTKETINVHFADVGNGSTSIITYSERATLIDCGGDYSKEIFSVLSRDSVKSIDSVFFTHLDDDHICFLDNLLEKFTVDKIYLPFFCDSSVINSKLSRYNVQDTKVIVVEKDTKINSYCGAYIKCFVENNKKVQYIDNLSAVYKFAIGESSVLFTGDIGMYQEYYFLEHGKEFDVDILCVPHHGSGTSSHQAFIDLCSPEYSVISVAENNSYGLPDEDVVDAYKEISKVLLTSKYSTVSFRFNSKGYEYLNEY